MARRRGERAAALARLAARMARAYDERLQSRRAQLFSAGQLLGAMSYRGVLSRGFALVRDETQRPLWRAAEVKPAQRLEIEFADGKIGAIAGGRVGPPMTPPCPRAAPTGKAGQRPGSPGVAVLTAFEGGLFHLARTAGAPRRSKPISPAGP